MFSSFEWAVAWRYLKARRADSFISVIAGFSLIGILLGVAVLIVVMSVMNGFRIELLDRVLGVNGQAWIVGFNGELRDYDKLAGEARKIDGVVSADPIIEYQVMATSDSGRAAGSLLRGIEPAALKENEYVGPNVIAGSLDEFGEEGTIAIGKQMAESLGVRVGDFVTLISPQGTATPFGTAPRLMAYQVVAIFEVGLYDYDNAFIFMPLADAQVYFRMKDAVTAIEIYVKDPDAIDRPSHELGILAGDRGYVTDWRQMNQSLFTALQVERNVMFIILSLIILVAVFNIISSLIILVKDKSKDIAILKTMGATDRSLMKVFMIAGASVGLTGTIAGLVVGLLLSINIKEIQKFLDWVFGENLWSPEVRFLTEMPSKVDPAEVILVVAIAFLLSVLATLPPARRVSKLDPVEILREEG